ncbi:MAG: (Fe-S)-binding protein [Bacteroidales bacterium]|nr:MAG: (Fe-S)-binding protein [Bacteroidales bacterium]
MRQSNRLTPDQIRALERFGQNLNGRLLTHLNSCVHCGLCGESCQYYLTTKDDRFIPGRKADLISSIYRRYFTLAGKIAPWLVGARDLNHETVSEMVDILFGACTMCGRCSLHCSIGVDIPYLVRNARSMLFQMGLVPEGLQSTVDAAVNTGNNMAIPRSDVIDTLQWLEQDLKIEVGDEKASIPIDLTGGKVFYTLNPRETKFFPLSISAMAKIFYAAQEEWTVSSDFYDVTNYAFYSGDDESARKLTMRLYDEIEKLGSDILVLAECGHGSRAIRWEGPEWVEKHYPFRVITTIELIAEYIRQERITLNPAKNRMPVTLHDPCNLVRSGGIIEEQRFILGKAVEHFVEMTPNRIDNYCCGGGGGQLSMSEFNERRLSSGKIKAEQIRKTGAKIVATPCHNCIDQLTGLNIEYNLDVEIKTIGEIVADVLVL